MKRFHVGTFSNNARDMVVGYQVVSNSRFGGIRTHLQIQGQHPSSLARARARCEEYAAKLEAEASANQQRSAR